MVKQCPVYICLFTFLSLSLSLSLSLAGKLNEWQIGAGDVVSVPTTVSALNWPMEDYRPTKNQYLSRVPGSETAQVKHEITTKQDEKVIQSDESVRSKRKPEQYQNFRHGMGVEHGTNGHLESIEEDEEDGEEDDERMASLKMRNMAEFARNWSSSECANICRCTVRQAGMARNDRSTDNNDHISSPDSSVTSALTTELDCDLYCLSANYSSHARAFLQHLQSTPTIPEMDRFERSNL